MEPKRCWKCQERERQIRAEVRKLLRRHDKGLKVNVETLRELKRLQAECVICHG